MWCASQRRTHFTDRSAFVLLDGLMDMSSSLRNLGAYFDESMSMTEHVNHLVRSCFNQLRRIRFIRRSLTTTVATRLVNSFVIARVDYCNSILAWLPKYQLSRNQSVLNVAARIVYDQARFEHLTPTLWDRLHWLRIPERIDFKRCLLVFKALHELAPVYIQNYCVEVSPRRCLWSSSQCHLVIPPPSNTVLFGERSFAVGGPSLWNHLPDNVNEDESIELLKQNLKTHLFRQSFEISTFSLFCNSALDFGHDHATAL